MPPCQAITDDGIEALTSSCPLLTTLDLNNCSRLTGLALAAIAAGCPRLQSLDLGASPNSSQRLATDEGLIVLARHCRGIRSLNVRYCQFVSAEAIEKVKALLCANVQVRR